MSAKPRNAKASAVPPNDLDTEAAVLSAVLLDLGALDKVIAFLKPEHFYSEAHRQIFRAALDVRELGQPIDVKTVGTRLKVTNRIAQVGGMSYITELLNASPATANVEAHARPIVELHTRRQLIALAQTIEARGYHDPVDALTFIRETTTELASFLESRTEPKPKRSPQLPAAVLDAMQAHPIVRVATGIAELDQRTNGGPRLRDLVAILGAPDAGKTTLAAHLADVMSAAGFIVGFIASDEDEESVTTRFAQRRNWSRADVDAREDFRDLREQMPAVHLYDLEWALEDVIEDLAERAANKPAVLIVDSLQTMNVGAAADGMGKADAIPLGLRFLRTAARVRRWLVIFTSEMVRGSYSGNGDRTAALASAKWSGDVEYSAKLMLALRNVDDSPDLLHVEISKSKICAKGEFHLRIDRAHQRLEAAEAPDKAERKQVKAQHDARELEQSATKLVKIVLSNPGIGTRTLHAKASVAGVGGRDRVDAVIEYCVDAGFIVDRPETHKSRIDHHYFVPSATEAGAAAAQ